jgi:hypothetical protein
MLANIAGRSGIFQTACAGKSTDERACAAICSSSAAGIYNEPRENWQAVGSSFAAAMTPVVAGYTLLGRAVVEPQLYC